MSDDGDCCYPIRDTPPPDARREPVTRLGREHLIGFLDNLRACHPDVYVMHRDVVMAAYDALADRLAASEKEVAEVKAERDRWYGGAQDRAIEINKLKQRLAEVERERDAWHNDASSHLQALCEKQAEANGLEQQLADAQATIARLEEQIKSQDVQMDAVRYRAQQAEQQAEQQVARLRKFAEYMKTKRREQWARWADEAEDPVSTDDEIEKLDEQFREACKALRETGA